jgi:hypothetical protein
MVLIFTPFPSHYIRRIFVLEQALANSSGFARGFNTMSRNGVNLQTASGQYDQALAVSQAMINNGFKMLCFVHRELLSFQFAGT